MSPLLPRAVRGAARKTADARRAADARTAADARRASDAGQADAGQVAAGQADARRDAGPAAPPSRHTVTLVGKPGCHLCDDAESVIERVCGELGVAWEKKDITQDEELYRKYWEQIPVILVDGAQHDFWRVDPARLRAALGR